MKKNVYVTCDDSQQKDSEEKSHCGFAQQKIDS